MENKSNLAKAVIAVMKEVKGMEKNSKVGTGSASYDGTKDQDVKEVFNEVMAKHGLCIMPIDYDEETRVDRWQEEVTYQNSGQTVIKQKQSVFTKVNAKYLLLHESGESQVIAGYGHGVDSQDKSAGKSTTYALKNTLLYTFLTPVGKIDDTDPTHSDEIPTPPPPQQPAEPTKQPAEPAKQPAKTLPKLVENSQAWKDMSKLIKDGKLKTLATVKKKYAVTEILQAKIAKMLKDNKPKK